MKKFEFTGEWETTIKSKWLSNLRSDKFYDPNSHLEWKRDIYNALHNEKVIVKIVDEINENIEPEVQQLNTLNYILNNDEAIYKNIFEAFVSRVVVDFKSYEHYPLEEQTFHLIKNIEQLPNHLGLNEISITNCYLNDYALFVLNFEFDGDYEHGLCMVFNKDRFLRHDEIGSLSFEGLITDIEYEDLIRRFNIRPEKKFYPVNKKYGLNKPWKNRANESYIKALLYDGSNDRILELVEKDYIVKDGCVGEGYGTLIEFAASYGNHEIISYLIKVGWSIGRAIPFCTQGQFRQDTIQFLVDNGANIDELNSNGQTSLFKHIYEFSQAKSNYEYQKERDGKRAVEHFEEMNRYRSQIQFLFSLGANPNNCDKEKNNYKTLLLKRWNENYLTSSGTFKDLEKIFNTPNKPRWRFW